MLQTKKELFKVLSANANKGKHIVILEISLLVKCKIHHVTRENELCKCNIPFR